MRKRAVKICTALKPVLLVPKFSVLVGQRVIVLSRDEDQEGVRGTIAFACWEHQYDYSYSLKMSVSLCNHFPGLPQAFGQLGGLPPGVIVGPRHR